MATMSTVVTAMQLTVPQLTLWSRIFPAALGSTSRTLHASALCPFTDEQSEASALFPKDGVL